MSTHHLAVIACENDDGVVELSGSLQCPKDLSKCLVHLGAQPCIIPVQPLPALARVEILAFKTFVDITFSDALVEFRLVLNAVAGVVRRNGGLFGGKQVVVGSVKGHVRLEEIHMQQPWTISVLYDEFRSRARLEGRFAMIHRKSYRKFARKFVLFGVVRLVA